MNVISLLSYWYETSSSFATDTRILLSQLIRDNQQEIKVINVRLISAKKKKKLTSSISMYDPAPSGNISSATIAAGRIFFFFNSKEKKCYCYNKLYNFTGCQQNLRKWIPEVAYLRRICISHFILALSHSRCTDRHNQLSGTNRQSSETWPE